MSAVEINPYFPGKAKAFISTVAATKDAIKAKNRFVLSENKK